jgi:hypothetical protein
MRVLPFSIAVPRLLENMIEGWIAVKAYRRFHKFGRRHILTQVGNRRCAGVQGMSEARWT